MVIANSNFVSVNATDIPQELAGVCGNHDCLFSEKCVQLTSRTSTCSTHGIQLAPGLYGDVLPNTRMYHPQGNTSLTIYECKALTDSHPVDTYPVSRIVDGVYTPAKVSCSASDCFDPDVSYEKTVSVTVLGIDCQRWDSVTPHIPYYLRGRSDLHNWCRIPDHTARPWCYTTDPNKRWDFCLIIDCP
ncbi:plasminogen-like [Ylistrum balloti]|uniref:plasminogen-like n=1 Tax=Ylistrum balloti TaxID=509963 RepID=UPI002905D049|nr:plasminogen-like [Ylistrum balloti]